MSIVDTPRLRIRELTLDDAPFILELLNERSFLRYIGDRGVRSLDDARAYIIDGALASYATLGFGLWCVELRESGESIGMCGLLKRPTLDDVDIGYAFLPAHWSRGYAREAAAAVLDHALGTLALPRIAAITDPDNAASIKLLESLGLTTERSVRLADDGPELLLFLTTPPPVDSAPASE